MAKQKNRFKVAPRVMAAVIGGYAGSQLTNILQNKVPFLATNDFMAPGVTLLIGTGLAMRAKNNAIKEGAMGAAIVAGVELLEQATAKFLPAKTGTVPLTQGTKQSVYM